MRAVLLLCVLAGACYSPTPQPGAPCSASGQCPEGLVCVPATQRCEDPNNVSDASVDACTTGTCEGDVLVGCGQSVTCANGCATSPEAHCRELAPSNGLTSDMLGGATADINSDKLNFDTGDGSIKRANIFIRTAGTGVIDGIRFEEIDGVAVWVANSWTLPAGESWDFSLGGRPVTLFANTTIDIAGTIDVGGSGSTGGPGATGSYTSDTEPPPGGCQGRAGRPLDATHSEGGGGGGGRGIAGGNGGASNQGGTLTGIGGNCADRPSTVPLRGGNGGGEGGDSSSNYGGGGGGAISLVAMQSITITGTVAAPGAGGAVGNGDGGGGGGSGGAVFIEAPVVTIPGNLTANGGGGAAAAGGIGGARGSLTSTTPAAGGTYTAPNGDAGHGGAGGTGPTNATNGQSYNYDTVDALGNPINYNRGGGGGGSVGVIEVRRITGDVTGLSSPTAVISNATVQ